jgi:hypothetical protein
MVFRIDKGNFAEPADDWLAFSDRRKPVSMPDGQGATTDTSHDSLGGLDQRVVIRLTWRRK